MKEQASERSKELSMLATSIAQLTEGRALYSTPISGLTLYRRDEVSEPVTGLYEPSICIIAQGAKKVRLGDDIYEYNSERYLFSGLHLPAVAQVIDASKQKPYLALRLTFDYREIAQLLADSQLPHPRSQKTERGMATGRFTLPLINAFQRLINLLDEEQDAAVLAPLIRREIFYRLLVGEQGVKMRQIAAMGTQSQQIAQAIAWLKANFSKPLSVTMLAEMANMGVSTFHHHFRVMTAMSPLQYQKQLRLQEARKLMLTEHIDAASASFNVGYESPSQFSREYSRLYGASPAKDIAALRQKMMN